ncbi:DUF5695 domain-containing protein [Microbacterium sp. GXF0217]
MQGDVGVDIWNLDQFHARFDPSRAAWTSFTAQDDAHGTEFLLTPEDFPQYDRPDARWFGTVDITVDPDDSQHPTRFVTSSIIEDRSVEVGPERIVVQYAPSAATGGLNVQQEYTRTASGIRWNTTIENPTDVLLTLRSVGFPLLMNQYFRGDDRFKYEQCVLRHACICGPNSWFYWSKSSGQMPLLLLKALGDTSVERFELARGDEVWGPRNDFSEAFEGLYTIFAISDPTEEFPECAGPRELHPGDSLTVSFLVSMQPDHESATGWLADNDGFFLETTPGMVLPVRTPAVATIRAQSRPVVAPVDRSCAAEEVVPLADGHWSVSLTLFAYGRCAVGVEIDGRRSIIVFWGIEPPEDIFTAQAEFITSRQWETDPADPAFHGLLMWDMAGRQRVNASSTTDVPAWMAGGSDEIGLVSGLFLSEWNVYRPDEAQVRVLDLYCRDFLEGRLTEQPGWRVHRAVPWFSMFDGWTGRGVDDVWRAFNYVHVANTYYNMYRIASRYEFDFLGDKLLWLRKAHAYTIAMFSHWMFPHGEGADRYGNMGELVIALELREALRAEGLDQEAAQLSGLVSKKAQYFAGKEYPFGSEMAYDSTAFEAVYAYGKAIGDTRIMASSVQAALANRGRQPVWHLFMTDLRASGDSQWNASYMTQLGAFPLFDWALQEGHHSPDLLKAMYGSYLAGFSIFNSGGYLSDEPENIGASGWIVVGERGEFSGKGDETYLKGVVAMSGESALGFFGALKCASSVAYEDGGRLAMLGGTLEELPGGYQATPQDGLRVRFFDTKNDWAIALERDALAQLALRDCAFQVTIDNITGDGHELTALLRVPQPGQYAVRTSAASTASTHKLAAGWNRLILPMPNAGSAALVVSPASA